MQRALAIAAILSVMLPAYPRSIRSRVISKVSLEHLVESADVIAQVRIVAVDEEIATPPLARARVEEAFKGTKADDVLVIDAWSVSEVGAVFLVFLDDAHHPVKERLRSGATAFVPDAEASYLTIREGLARQMPVRLTYAFGKLDVAVSFPVEYVELPRALKRAGSAGQTSRSSRSAGAVVSPAPRSPLARRLTLGCSRRGPLRSCLPSCAIMASRATRLNPGPLGGSMTMTIELILAQNREHRLSEPAPSVGEISACETAIARQLPAQYREFLIRGGLNDLRFSNTILSPSEIVESRAAVPNTLIPFASNGCSDLYCWSEDAADPPVVFWDHEDETISPTNDSFVNWLAENRL